MGSGIGQKRASQREEWKYNAWWKGCVEDKEEGYTYVMQVGKVYIIEYDMRAANVTDTVYVLDKEILGSLYDDDLHYMTSVRRFKGPYEFVG